MPFPKKEITPQQAKLKIARYCAYQDRCEKEVRTKLQDFGLDEFETEQLIDFLIDEKYLDEERFVYAFVNGKFNLKKWGKLKIKAHLRNKSIPESLIEKHLNEIPHEDYQATISTLLEQKKGSIKDSNKLVIKQKTVAYLQQKGFELDLIFNSYKD